MKIYQKNYINKTLNLYVIEKGVYYIDKMLYNKKTKYPSVTSYHMVNRAYRNRNADIFN